jgi:GrpB-like predicted nucleotidyltransferase (UPF0157 family)/RimJ/RimL family protein N-acetyltransferase
MNDTPTGKRIRLVEYDPSWPAKFRQHAAVMEDRLCGAALQIEHIGSTAVPGLAAKAKIDVLLVVPDSADEASYVPQMEAAGYVLLVREPDFHEHRMFSTPELDVNIHVVSRGCTEIERWLTFRDRLRSDEGDRRLYEDEKRALALHVWPNTDAYARAKTEVIERILARAREAGRRGATDWLAPLHMMRTHARILFPHDVNGRLAAMNEYRSREPPRFYIGKTTDATEIRFRSDVDEGTIAELTSAARQEPNGADRALPSESLARYAAVLSRTAPVQKSWSGPAYFFPSEMVEPEEVLRIQTENARLLLPHFVEWRTDVETSQPFLALVRDGRAVSICAAAGSTQTAYEAGVETAKEHRGKGHAALVVSAWAAAVHSLRRIPLYSTSWENTASRRVATKLGLVQYGSDLWIR